VVFLIDRAGVTGPDGPSHHGMFDLAYLTMIPNMVVGAPADAIELCAMIETALDHDGPIAIRYPKSGAATIPTLPVEPLDVGVAELIAPAGDVLLVAAGRMVEVAEKAAAGLATHDVSAGVVNARWVKPLDPRIAEWSAGVEHVITLEDGVLSGGLGSAVMAMLADHGQAKKVTRIGAPDEFLPFGSASDILAGAGMDPDSVVSKVLAVVGH
jgi:1-deoxy-D-xylulose-5-phosphate synthase